MKNYLIKDVLKILKFKRSSGNFYNMVEDLKLPVRHVMKKDTNNRLRKFRFFTEEDLRIMKNYRKEVLDSKVFPERIVHVSKEQMIKTIQYKISEIDRMIKELKSGKIR